LLATSNANFAAKHMLLITQSKFAQKNIFSPEFSSFESHLKEQSLSFGEF
jgi:hypothetical protein